MNFIREMVSKKKIRYKDEKFNLDLTYITPRIIAMAYPASGVESLYRNKMDDVAEFLNSKHKDKYYVINTSNRKYDYTKFNSKVIDIEWPNHHPCRFYYFCKLILEIAKMMMDTPPDTVFVVHCLGGKGRTGSLIGCLLNISGIFKTIKLANQYFLEKRGVNVTYQSQVRYMLKFRYYFYKGLPAINCSRKELTSVSIKSAMNIFFQDMVFKISFADFKVKDEVILEKCFSPVFEKENNIIRDSKQGKFIEYLL